MEGVRVIRMNYADARFTEYADKIVDVGLWSDDLDVEPDEEEAAWMRDLAVPEWVDANG